VSVPDSVFHGLLEKFYAGGPDKETLRLLGIREDKDLGEVVREKES
jgi:hypothetical protein